MKAKAAVKKVSTAKADKDGWIKWQGGNCPVVKGTLVDVKHRDGDTGFGKAAGMAASGMGSGNAAAYRWDHLNNRDDIVAYRLAQPAKATKPNCKPAIDSSKPAAAKKLRPAKPKRISDADVVRALKEIKVSTTARDIAAKLGADSRAVATAARKAVADGRITINHKGGVALYRFVRLTAKG